MLEYRVLKRIEVERHILRNIVFVVRKAQLELLLWRDVALGHVELQPKA